MLAEKLLQTRLISFLFLLSAVSLFILGSLNFSYGLYNLVYTAWFVASLYAGVGLYVLFAPEQKYLKPILLGICCTSTFCFFMLSFEFPREIIHWVFPIALLSYIALSQRFASLLNQSIFWLFSFSLIINDSIYSGFVFGASFLLFVALASTYAQLHQKRNRTLVELEIHDPLTRAYNLRHLEDTLKKEVCRSDRTGKPLSLISLEIDYFPQLKNMHSNSTIQSLFVSLAETLKAMIRAGDSDYFDGKHTAYLLLPCTPSEGVLVIAERIRRTIEESAWPEVDSISVSLGCTTYNPKERSSDSENMANKLIAESQLALVESQKNGHNRVCFHNSRQ